MVIETRETRTREQELIDVLRNEQRKLGMNQSQFAARLGVHKSVWSRVSRGQLPVGMTFTRRVMQAFPQFSAYVSLFLQSK